MRDGGRWRPAECRPFGQPLNVAPTDALSHPLAREHPGSTSEHASWMTPIWTIIRISDTQEQPCIG
jgi:hypothetical protein